jgi:zinc protease
MPSQIIDIPYQKFVLPNGLTVIVHEDHKAPIIALNVWYHVGSKNEAAGKTGFAHLFEHLMFGGSEHMPDTYIEAMERVGATDLNGTTNEDRTNYFENVPVSAFDYALFAESDRMGHFYNAIGQDVLDLQRGVVENEKRQGDNQPYAIADELITKATYPANHPYAHTVIGSMEDLKAASLEDVKSWFKTYYGPSNAVLVVAGAIDFPTVREKVTKYFGDIPPGPPIAHQEAWVAKMTSEHRETVQDRVPLARIYKVWNVPQYGTADATYLNLVSSIFTSGKSSRLYKRLVYDDQIAANVMTYIDQKEISGQFLVMATAKPGESLDKLEKAINEEITWFLKEGPTIDELDRAKTQALAGFIRGVERIGGFGGKSDILARSETYTGSPDGYKEVLSRIEAATAAQLKDSANNWLADGAYVLNVEPFPALTAHDEGIDRAHMPEVQQNVVPKFPKLEKATLSNGLNVILAERHDIPVINFWLQVEAGYAADEFATLGTSKMMASLLTSGTKTRTALQISDEAQSFGALLTAGGGLDLTTVYLSALKSKLDPSLHLFADVILNPVFPESDFKRQQSLQLAGIENEKSTPTQMALRVLPPLLYGTGHAYSVPLTGSGTMTSVSAITRDQIVNFHKTWFKPNNATLIIVGDTTLSEILPKLDQLLAGWQPGEVPKVNINRVEGPSVQDVYLIDKPGALQSVIIGGSLAPAPNAVDEIAFEMANNVFGGTFSARLNMNLREDKHWSYGAQSLLYGARGQRPFISIAGVQTDKTKESIAEMSKELQEMIGARPVSEAELARVKDQAILEMGGARETMAAIGSAIAEIIEYKLPDDYWDTFGEKVSGLTELQVNGAAKTLIQPQKTVWVIVGDRASIEADIKSLNIGPIHHVDADGKLVE